MYRKEIQTERTKRNQRMDPTLVQATLPELEKPVHELRRVIRRDRSEAHANGSIRIALDDVAVFVFVTARVTHSSPVALSMNRTLWYSGWIPGFTTRSYQLDLRTPGS